MWLASLSAAILSPSTQRQVTKLRICHSDRTRTLNELKGKAERRDLRFVFSTHWRCGHQDGKSFKRRSLDRARDDKSGQVTKVRICHPDQTLALSATKG